MNAQKKITRSVASVRRRRKLEQGILLSFFSEKNLLQGPGWFALGELFFRPASGLLVDCSVFGLVLAISPKATLSLLPFKLGKWLTPGYCTVMQIAKAGGRESRRQDL